MTPAPGGVWSIRRSGENDGAALAELHRSVATEDVEGIDAPGELLIADLTRIGIVAEGGLSLVAEIEGEIAGHLLCRRDEAGTGEIALIVSGDFRGIGVGGALLDAAEEWARGESLSALALKVSRRNQKAIALYTQKDFEPAEDSDPETLVMSKSLR